MNSFETPTRKPSIFRSLGETRKKLRPLIALSATGVTLAVAMLAYASSSNQVEQLASLAVPRTAHTATVMADGTILITGGRDTAGTALAVAEIFDPKTKTSRAIGDLVTGRTGHTATLLKDGRVLIAGGTNATGTLASAEIFEPLAASSGFTALSAEMGAPRTRHTATLLNSGKVLLAGGDAAGSAELFDPATETFSITLLSMAEPRSGHSATLFSDDTVLLAGGQTDSMESFSAADQTFTLETQHMTHARISHEAIALSDTRLLFFGGDVANTIDEWDFSTDTLALKATMDAPASSATLLANGKILLLRSGLAGIYAPDAADENSAFTAFDESAMPGSSMLARRGQSATELPEDKRILVAGGVDGYSELIEPVALFNPARIWTDKDDYQPDDVVLLNGSGWRPNEDIYLFVVDSATDQWTYKSTDKTNANGDFAVSPYFIVEQRHLGVTFNVTAYGAESTMQAAVMFTDAGIAGVAVVGAQTPSPVLPGNTATYGNGTAANSVNVTFNGNNSTCSVSLTASGLPTGATATFNPSSFWGLA